MKHNKIVIALFSFVLIAGFIFGSSITGEAAKDFEVKMVPRNFTELADMAGPAVVNIRTEKTMKGGGSVYRNFRRGPFDENDPFNEFFEKFFGDNMPKDFKQRSLGSGFIIDKDGYIVTNNHVVENADAIKVVLSDDKEFDAKIIGRDPYTDLALIKIKPKKDLPTVKIGDSDKLQVGEWVVAIGSPFGLNRTVTAGIVSAKGRVIGSGPYDNFIQTDASINPGNSGGPLINMKGEVIGINTMIIAGGQGIGFAIPVNLAKGIIEQLKDSGEVTRGWLGVTIQDLKGDLAEYYGLKGGEGALVVDVIPGDPADEAGIKPKDVIVEVNGKKIKSSRDLTTIVAGIGVGEKAKIMVLRNGRNKTFTVEIGKRPEKVASKEEAPQKQGDELGIRVSDITPEIAQRFNIKRNAGVMVIGVELNSKAAKAGFQRGDIIIEINRKNIKNVDDYKKSIKKIHKGKEIAFLVERINAGLIVIQLKK